MKSCQRTPSTEKGWRNTPSSVSRQIETLEEQLGVKLLTRTTRKLSMTEAGAAYKSQVDHLLAELDVVNENIAAFGNEPRGRLKVSSRNGHGCRHSHRCLGRLESRQSSVGTLPGLGIALLPYWLVRERLDAGTLVQLVSDYPMVSQVGHLLT